MSTTPGSATRAFPCPLAGREMGVNVDVDVDGRNKNSGMGNLFSWGVVEVLAWQG